MTTKNTDYEARDDRARIDELPASDMQMRGEDRDTSRRVPPPEDPEDIASPAPDPGDPRDPEDLHVPTPRDPDDE